MNQKGFANIILIVFAVILAGTVGYLTLIKKTPLSITEREQKSTFPPPPQTISPANISQLTKNQVLNGYDQCGVQFKNGEFSLSNADYERLDAEKSKTADPARDPWRDGCDASSGFSSDNITFADLDGDGIHEALVPARIVRASSGGVLYVFKNVTGTARVVDRIVFGKGNGKVISVNKGIVVVEFEDFGPNGFTAMRETYQFVNGRLVKRSPVGLPSKKAEISWFECIQLPGSAISQTYPEQCVTSDGRRAVNPATPAPKNPIVNKDIVYMSLPAVVRSSPVLGGKPAIEIEVWVSNGFPIRNELAVLRIGAREFTLSRYPESGDTHSLIFTLTPEEFAKTAGGDPVSVYYGRGGESGKRWNFGPFNKGPLMQGPLG